MPPIPPAVFTTSAAAARLQSIQRHLASQSGSISGQRGLNTVATAGNNKRRMVAQKKHKVAIVGSGNW